MARETILLVEDEEDIAELIRFNLEANGYHVVGVETGEGALSSAQCEAPALILLDRMLPGMDGLDVCRTLKRDPRTAVVPIIMVTAKGEESDVVAGLELGADDYITKPFSPRVLVARVRAILRRQAQPLPDENSHIRVHGIEIDPRRHAVRAGNDALELTYTEFRVLHFLARRPGWVFTRSQIVDAVRGSNYPVTERSVDVQVVALRKKLGSRGDMIETVRGVGYRFKE